nr:hypothetical protein [Tanacetum cinerariifolium]
MEQYMSKIRGNYGSGVVRPKINDKTHFELKGQYLKELHKNTFSGSEHEDTNEHIKKVLEIVDLFYIPEVTQDQVMLQVFPMSLTRAASRWLRNEPSVDKNGHLRITGTSSSSGPDLIQRIADELALAVEIDFTWSFGFGSVEPGRPPIPFSSMNLVSDSSNVYLRSGCEEFPLLRWLEKGFRLVLAESCKFPPFSLQCKQLQLRTWENLKALLDLEAPLEYEIKNKSSSGELDFTRPGVSKSLLIERNTLFGFSKGQYVVLTLQNTLYCLEEQIRCLDCRDQYVVLSGRVDTSYPTGGYGISVDLSEQDT